MSISISFSGGCPVISLPVVKKADSPILLMEKLKQRDFKDFAGAYEVSKKSVWP